MLKSRQILLFIVAAIFTVLFGLRVYNADIALAAKIAVLAALGILFASGVYRVIWLLKH